MKVAILGAAGAIGRAVAETLVARGQSVRVVGRSAAKLAALPFEPLERVPADVSTEAGCRTALEGVEAAVYTLGLPYTKKSFAAYPPMMEACLRAARAANVRELILITNVYPYGLPQTERVSEDHPREPVAVKGRFRKEQEDVLLAAHSEAGLRTLSLRLPNFYGPDAALSLSDGIVKAALAGKTADLLAPVDLPQELCFTPDVGPVVADLLMKPEAFGRGYNFAGAGVLTWREFATAIFEAAGATPKFRLASPRMVSVMGWFWPLMRELSELSYLQTRPVLLDDRRLREVLPNLKKTPYAEGIRRTVEAYRAAQAHSGADAQAA